MSLLSGLAAYLAAEGIGTWRPTATYTSGEVGIVIETVPANPPRVISLWQYGGAEADAANGVDEPLVQVRVRGTQDPRISRDQAQAVYDLLHGAGHFELPDGTYVDSIIGQQAGPTWLSQDQNSRHEHVCNFRVEIHNPASVNRA